MPCVCGSRAGVGLTTSKGFDTRCTTYMAQIEIAALLAVGTSTTNSYTPSLPGGLIAWAVCNGRKRQQIGGWLLFYYWQLYSGAVMTVLFLAMGFQSYVPESYDDPGKYHLFLASSVPVLVFFCVQLAVGTMLISVRTWDMLKLLRWTICAELVAALIGAVIDANYFPDSLPFDFFTIVPGILWLAYFFRSQRVGHVFKSHDWDTAVNVIYPPKVSVAT